MRVGITGVHGLLGWHTRCRLHVEDDIDVVGAGRATFAEPERVDAFVRGCDAIVHLAGINRAHDAEIERGNPELARTLVGALERTGATPHVLYSSSIHVDRDTVYGRSKRVAGEIIGEWAERVGAAFSNLLLPHVFGECGRPFYNSVVSTFCYQLANGETPRIDVDGELNLLHAQQVADLVLDRVRGGQGGIGRPDGQQVKVSEMLEGLQSMASGYLGGVIPDLSDEFDLRLFNTFRSYLFPDHYPVALKLNTDPRGSLFEAVKTRHGGQAFLSTTHPEITRGDHFHFQKVERFLVVHGEAVIRLRRLFDDRVVEYRVRGDEPVFVDMPTLHTHNITNVGSSDTLTLFWSHQIFDPERPDTYREPVEPLGQDTP